MSHITLVRHGQANTQARDEASYDQLSELGYRQSRWLGTHLRNSGDVFARVYTGTLIRHVQTAEAVAAPCADPPVQDARLNELEYFTMAQIMLRQHDIPVPTDRESFLAHLPLLLTLWRGGQLKDAPESFAAFEARVSAVLTEIAAGSGRAFVVTSGGLIAMSMRVCMGLSISALAHASLMIKNTSIHQYQPLPGGLALTLFNATPHLDAPDRHTAQTFL
ncbi:histidine phosphatase family protein [Puniceibacterium sp. IMCC21224]|uniref:histidine phosphatase family protein n=1 Tax=Puniceibacterium sp. IMCC21224 TaxID=1618204 RepID=UPI00064DC49B|nr:histidine phosphatase family protein [Puniceibacterium sp. IMCC21224]KMK68710.1 fructose-2,6-bisphosphatase [Puniceibacterium sp. IMCC21224]